MRRLFLLLFVVLLSWSARACPVCRPRVQAGIHNAAYRANLGLVLLPVGLLLAAGLGLFYGGRRDVPTSDNGLKSPGRYPAPASFHASTTG